MSYIYALYFDKLNAVKIGKADDLESRLSELVSVWGKIKKGRAHKVDDIFVLKYEKELHNSFSKFKKKLPQGDGYTEFFEPNIWLKLNKDNFLPISDSTLRKINNKKQKNNKQNKTSLTLTLTTKQKDTIFKLYQNDYELMKKRLMSKFTKKDENMIELIRNSMQDDLINKMQSEINELNRQLQIARYGRDEEKRLNKILKTSNTILREEYRDYYDLKKQITYLEDKLTFANLPNNVDDLIKNKKMISNIEHLQRQNTHLKTQLSISKITEKNTNEKRSDAYRYIREIRRISKRVLTQFNREKIQPNTVNVINKQIEEWLDKVKYI